MNRKIVILVLLIALNVQCHSPRSVQGKSPFYIFLLMGQSNMAGYGALLPADTLPTKGIFYIPTITKGLLEWLPAKHPLHNRLKSDQFGLGLPFAQEFQKTHPGVIVGLIPVAYGGAAIDQLNKGTAVYNDALLKAHFAQKSGAIIKGVLWHQGESDTVTEDLAMQYGSKLQTLIKDFRNDIGISDLPFIVGELATFYGTGKDHHQPQRVKQINQVKDALRNLPNQVKNAGFVESAGGVSIDNHHVHFDRDSYIFLGKRYAQKYDELVNNHKE